MAPPTQPVSDEWLHDLLADIEETGPGAAIGFYDHGELVASATKGQASLEHRAPITVETIFDIASVSKQITATCVVLLQRDGLLSLDDDLRNFVPELKLREPVTLRQCAQHTGGLRDYLSLGDAVGAPLACVELEPDFLRFVSPQRETNFGPGSNISYSNTGYVLLATVVSRVSGRSFQEFARERVFEPLRMTRSRFRDGLGFVMDDLASSYEAVATGYRRGDLAEALVGDGAALTCVSDLSHWQGFLLDGRTLGPDLRDQIVKPSVLTDGRVCPYGLGVRISEFEGQPMLWHGGSMYHFLSELVCLPEVGLGVSVLANRRDAAVGEIARHVARRALGLPPARRATSVVGQVPAPRPGTWLAPADDWHLRLRVEPGGDLTVSTGEHEDRYERTDSQSWTMGAHARLEHQRDGDRAGDDEDGGELRWTDHIGRSVVYRRPAGGAQPPAESIVGHYTSAELDVGVVIAITDAGPTLELGATGAHPMTFLTTDRGDALYAAGPLTVRLRTSEDTVFVSAMDLQRLRFVRRTANEE